VYQSCILKSIKLLYISFVSLEYDARPSTRQFFYNTYNTTYIHIYRESKEIFYHHNILFLFIVSLRPYIELPSKNEISKSTLESKEYVFIDQWHIYIEYLHFFLCINCLDAAWNILEWYTYIWDVFFFPLFFSLLKPLQL
jgi:hypothetical protein